MDALLSKILQPGVYWMRCHRLPAKLAVLMAIVVLPTLWLLWSTTSCAVDTMRLLQRQRAGFAVVDGVVELVATVETHRGWSHRWLNGEQQAAAPLDNLGQALRTQVARLDGLVDAQAPTLAAAAMSWKRLRAPILALSARPAAGADPVTRWQAHTDEIENLRQFLLALGNEAGLAHAGEGRIALLADFAVNRAVGWMESAARLRGLGAGLLVRGDTTVSEQARMLLDVEMLESEVQQFDIALATWRDTGIAAPLTWGPAAIANKRFMEIARSAFDSNHVAAEPTMFFDAGTAAQSALMRLIQEVDAIGVAEVDQRMHRTVGGIVVDAMIVGLCALMLAYVLACLQTSVTTRLGALMQALDAVITGKLGVVVDLSGKDELAVLGEQVEQVALRLSELVGSMRSSAMRVGEASAEVANSGLALSQRTEDEAMSLRQSVGAVQGLSASVASSARAVSSLEALTNTLSNQAQAGSLAMREACAAMGTLEASALRVAEVNNVIDDVAFQTNMLAINAAVEAARAGESGKGFAVVAGEVRELARRCMQAASEIRELIDQTNGRVDITRETMGEASRSIDGLAGGVAEVSSRLKEIALSSAGQCRSLDEVSAQVGHLDMLTSDNAQMVERTQNSSAMLTEQAQLLRRTVETIQLRQGNADEARALVERAVGHVREVGWDAAVKAFNGNETGWKDRDLYLFALDRQGRYLVHGGNAAMIGGRLVGLSEDAAAAFVAQARESLVDGHGWRTYGARSPVSHRVVAKTSFLQAVDDEVLFGCGVHGEDIICEESALGTLIDREVSI